MFRLAIFALLAAAANAVGTCTAPQVMADDDDGDTILTAGDTFPTTTIVPDGTMDVWYSLTVADNCVVTVAMSNCNDNSASTIKMDVFSDTVACGSLPVDGDVDTGTGECGLLGTGSVGAAVSFGHNDVEETTYLIRVSAADGGALEFNGDPEVIVTTNLPGTCGGDPHFRRWGHQVRDSFHGECDLVLFHKEQVEGKDLDVHVRTTMRDSYSYVSGVAMKHGDDVIEFNHDAFFVNGAKPEEEALVAFGNNNKIVMADGEKRKFEVAIADEVVVEVSSTKHFMSVSLNGIKKGLSGSAGILGEFGTGDMISRDGNMMSNFQDYGFEWQVSPSDPQIFMDAREPQLPYERCRMPSVSAESRRRKLRGQDAELYKQALAACAENNIPENMQACVDDVMFTGELDLAFVF